MEKRKQNLTNQITFLYLPIFIIQYHRLILQSMTELERKFTSSVSIDLDTDEGLDWLKVHLDSPKAWILKRLVAQEIERVRGEEK